MGKLVQQMCSIWVWSFIKICQDDSKDSCKSSPRPTSEVALKRNQTEIKL